MKILVIASYSRSLVNFRGHLLRKMRSLGHEIFTLAPDYTPDVTQKLKEWDIQFKKIRLNRTGVNVVQDLQTLYSLYTSINSIKPELVLSYTVKPVVYGSIVASWCRVPRIFSMITGLGSFPIGSKKGIINRIITWLYIIAVKKNNRLIFQNADDKEEFVKAGLVEHDKTSIVNGSGVDLDYYHQEPVPLEPVRFLFIGRLIKDKGVTEFAEACRILKKHYSSVRFEILGDIDSNPRSLDKDVILSWEREGSITWHGPTDDVRPFIKDATVFVLPSYREGTPRTALESMSMGRPIITTDAPGCRETVIDGKNGFLVPVKDVEKLVEAMEKFIVDPSLALTMGKESRLLAERKFDVHQVNNRILQILGLIQ